MTTRAGSAPAPSPVAVPCALSTMAEPHADRAEACWALYRSGYAAGWEAGWKAADEDLATLQREAAAVVHSLAGIPPRDLEADKAARERRDAHFAERCARWGGGNR